MRGAQKQIGKDTAGPKLGDSTDVSGLYSEQNSLRFQPVESKPYLVMSKRRHTSVNSSQDEPTGKRQKLTFETPVQRTLSTVELLDHIIRFVPKDKVKKLGGVSKWFQNMIKYGPIQEYLYDVPPKGKVGIFSFRGERIEDYVRYIAPGSQPSLEQAHESCIHGYGGEGFIDRNDEVYRDITSEDIEMILENKHCAKPCLLDSTRLAHCNLSPGPFERLMCTLLVKAWDADGDSESTSTAPSQPSNFKIICDGRLLGDIGWEKYRMGGKFSKPPPKTTSEATVNWVFESLASYASTRNDLICGGAAIDDMDYVKGMTLGDSDIMKAFRAARGTSWSLEQTCYIVDRIPESLCT